MGAGHFIARDQEGNKLGLTAFIDYDDLGWDKTIALLKGLLSKKSKLRPDPNYRNPHQWKDPGLHLGSHRYLDVVVKDDPGGYSRMYICILPGAGIKDEGPGFTQSSSAILKTLNSLWDLHFPCGPWTSGVVPKFSFKKSDFCKF